MGRGRNSGDWRNLGGSRVMDGEQVKVCVGTTGPVREAHRRGRLERERRMGVD